MAFVLVFILGLLMIALSYLFWYYMQPFQAYKVEISQQSIRKRKILYKQYRGSYLDIKDEINKMVQIVEKAKMNRKELKDLSKPVDEIIEEHIGVFYDNPE